MHIVLFSWEKGIVFKYKVLTDSDDALWANGPLWENAYSNYITASVSASNIVWHGQTTGHARLVNGL